MVLAITIKIMKRYLPLFLVFFHYCTASAQSWDGKVRWLYEQQDFVPIPNDYLEIVKIKDTIVQNRKCALFEERYLILQQNAFTKSEYAFQFILIKYDGKIDFYDPDGKSFLPIYDFNKKAGESFFTTFPFADKFIFEVKVDSVVEEYVFNKKRKVQYVSGSQDAYFMNGRIIEDLGSTEYLFAQSGVTDPPPGGYLLCYDDQDQVGSSENICDIKLSAAVAPKGKLMLYPQPIVDVLNITALSAFEYKIYTMDGRLVLSGKSYNGQIDFNTIQTGTYMVQIINGHQVISRKVFKL
jgi:hypothetical protein